MALVGWVSVHGPPETVAIDLMLFTLCYVLEQGMVKVAAVPHKNKSRCGIVS